MPAVGATRPAFFQSLRAPRVPRQRFNECELAAGIIAALIVFACTVYSLVMIPKALVVVALIVVLGFAAIQLVLYVLGQLARLVWRVA